MSVNITLSQAADGNAEYFVQCKGLEDKDQAKFDTLKDILLEQGPTCLGHNKAFDNERAFHVWLARTHHTADGESLVANNNEKIKLLIDQGWKVENYHPKNNGSKSVDVELNKADETQTVTVDSGFDYHAPLVDGIYLTLHVAQKLFPELEITFSLTNETKFVFSALDPANTDDPITFDGNKDPSLTHFSELGAVLDEMESKEEELSLLRRNPQNPNSSAPITGPKTNVTQYDGKELYERLRDNCKILGKDSLWDIGQTSKVQDFLFYYTPLPEMIESSDARMLPFTASDQSSSSSSSVESQLFSQTLGAQSSYSAGSSPAAVHDTWILKDEENLSNKDLIDPLLKARGFDTSKDFSVYSQIQAAGTPPQAVFETYKNRNGNDCFTGVVQYFFSGQDKDGNEVTMTINKRAYTDAISTGNAVDDKATIKKVAQGINVYSAEQIDILMENYRASQEQDTDKRVQRVVKQITLESVSNTREAKYKVQFFGASSSTEKTRTLSLDNRKLTVLQELSDNKYRQLGKIYQFSKKSFSFLSSSSSYSSSSYSSSSYSDTDDDSSSDSSSSYFTPQSESNFSTTKSKSSSSSEKEQQLKSDSQKIIATGQMPTDFDSSSSGSDFDDDTALDLQDYYEMGLLSPEQRDKLEKSLDPNNELYHNELYHNELYHLEILSKAISSFGQTLPLWNNKKHTREELESYRVNLLPLLGALEATMNPKIQSELTTSLGEARKILNNKNASIADAIPKLQHSHFLLGLIHTKYLINTARELRKSADISALEQNAEEQLLAKDHILLFEGSEEDQKDLSSVYWENERVRMLSWEILLQHRQDREIQLELNKKEIQALEDKKGEVKNIIKPLLKKLNLPAGASPTDINCAYYNLLAESDEIGGEKEELKDALESLKELVAGESLSSDDKR